MKVFNPKVKITYRDRTLSLKLIKLSLTYVIFQASDEQLQEIRENNNGRLIGSHFNITFSFDEKSIRLGKAEFDVLLTSFIRRSAKLFEAKFSFRNLTSDQRVNLKKFFILLNNA